jgi:hypothetical protein
MDGLELLTSQINERYKGLADALCGGAAKSFDEYKQMVGELRGLSFANLSIQDLVRKLENDNDSGDGGET